MADETNNIENQSVKLEADTDQFRKGILDAEKTIEDINKRVKDIIGMLNEQMSQITVISSKFDDSIKNIVSHENELNNGLLSQKSIIEGLSQKIDDICNIYSKQTEAADKAGESFKSVSSTFKNSAESINQSANSYGIGNYFADFSAKMQESKNLITEIKGRASGAASVIRDAMSSSDAEAKKSGLTLKDELKTETSLISEYNKHISQLGRINDKIAEQVSSYNNNTNAISELNAKLASLKDLQNKANDAMSLVPKNYNSLEDYRNHLISVRDEYAALIKQVQDFKIRRGDSPEISERESNKGYNISRNGSQTIITNDEAVETKKNLEIVNNEINDLDKAQQKLGSENTNLASKSGMTGLKNEISKTESAISKYGKSNDETKKKIEGLMNVHTAESSAMDNTASSIRSSADKMDALTASTRETTAAAIERQNAEKAAAEAAEAAAARQKAAVSAIKTAQSGVTQAVKIVGSGTKDFFGFIGNGVKGINSKISTSIKGISDANNLVKRLSKNFNSLFSIMVRMIKRKLIFNMFSGLKEGTGNLAKESERTNAILSSLIGSLKTLANQIGAAFDPILQAIGPVINQVINGFTQTIDKASQMTAAFTGSDVYKKALPVAYDYAASLDASAKSASNAEKAQKSLNKTVLSFDQLHKMDSNKDTSSTATGSDSNAKNFADTKISSGIKKNVADIKKMIADGQWKGLGTKAADAVNKAFSWMDKSLSWSNRGEKLTKTIKAMTGVFNEFIAKVRWGMVGKTAGDALTTLSRSINLFLDNTDLKAVGDAFGRTLNGLFENVDSVSIGKSIMGVVQSGQDVFAGLVGSFNPSSSGDVFKGIIGGMIDNFKAEEIGGSIGTLFTKIGTFLKKSFGDKDKWQELGGKIADGLDAFFTNFNGSELADGINTFLDAVTTTIGAALQNDKWKGKAATDIHDFITGLDWGKIFELAAPFIIAKAAASSAVSGIGTAIGGKIIGGLSAKLAGGEIASVGTTAGTAVGGAFCAAFLAAAAAAIGYLGAANYIKQTVAAKKEQASAESTANNKERKAAIYTSIYNNTEGKNAFANPKEASSDHLQYVINAVKKPDNITGNKSWSITRQVIDDSLLKKLKIKKYASGGYQDNGDVFVANDGAPEIVGSIGGKSAVVNNNQIIEAVSQGVSNAVAKVMASFSKNDSSKTGNGEVIMTIDGETIGRVVLKQINKIDKRTNPTISVA